MHAWIKTRLSGCFSEKWTLQYTDIVWFKRFKKCSAYIYSLNEDSSPPSRCSDNWWKFVCTNNKPSVGSGSSSTADEGFMSSKDLKEREGHGKQTTPTGGRTCTWTPRAAEWCQSSQGGWWCNPLRRLKTSGFWFFPCFPSLFCPEMLLW